MNRVECLHRLLEKHDVSLILVYSTSNDGRFFRWLTGTPCRSGSNYLCIDREALEWLELGYHASDLPSSILASARLVGEIDEIPAALGELTRNRARIGLIGDVPFWHLEEVEAKVVDLKPESDPLLWIKSPDEIQEVALLGSRLVRDIERTVSGLSQGTTEQEIANILRGHLHADGGREAFPTSIVSGERLQTSTLGAPSNRPLGPAEALCIDCGIESRAVFSDCTRMYFLPGSPLASSYARLCDVQKRVIYQIAPGMTFGAIAKLFGEELALCGFVNPNLRLTELGHGIGFALHETPFLMNAQSEHVQVVPGMVFTLEPEISVNGYQIRVEDMVAITSTEAILLTS